MNAKPSEVILTLILSVCVIVPFSNDIFIASFPEMNSYFPGNNISLVLSVFFLGLAIAQPIYGPLSDRFGRRPTLLAGLWIYTLASALAMLTNTFQLLIWSRFFQALGVCCASVSVYAIVKDVYENEGLISALSIVTAVIGAGPALAPLLGAVLAILWGWRASFIFLFILGVFYVIVIQFLFRETLVNKNMKALTPKNIVINYLSLIKLPGFSLYCVIRGLPYGIFFSYFSLSPTFLMEQMHFNFITYGLTIALNGAIMITLVRLSPRLIKKFDVKKVLQLSFSLIIAGSLIMLGINTYFEANIYSFIFPMFIITAGIGMALLVASTSAIQLASKEIAGSAAALVNTSSFLFAALATSVTPRLIHSVAEFGLSNVIISIAGFPFLWKLRKLDIVQTSLDASVK